MPKLPTVPRQGDIILLVRRLVLPIVFTPYNLITQTQEMTSMLRRHFLLPKIRKAVIQ